MGDTAVVIGVGAGLGAAVARRFAAEGCEVALFARSEPFLREVSQEIRANGGTAQAVPTDITDAEAVADGFETVREAFGAVDILIDCVYSTETSPGGIREIGVDDLRGAWQVETEGVFRCVKTALPDLLARDGTIIFTNSTQATQAAPDGLARSVARFGLRGLAQSLARDLGPDGVHVVHVLVDGWIDKPSLREAAPDRPDEEWMDPEAIAATYWHLVEQDRSAWTAELDLRGFTDSVDT